MAEALLYRKQSQSMDWFLYDRDLRNETVTLWTCLHISVGLTQWVENLFNVHEFRSIRSQMFFKMGLLNDFAKFIGKHLCQRPATLFKKRLCHRYFPVNFAKFLRTSFFTEHLWWPPLLMKSTNIIIMRLVNKTIFKLHIYLFERSKDKTLAFY